MTEKKKRLLDYLPLLLLILSAIYLIVIASTTSTSLQLQHIVGLILLPIPMALLFFKHKLGVITLGFLLLLGVVGLVSYSPEILTATFNLGVGEKKLQLIYFQPGFLALFVFHFIVSFRYYIGIVTKEYWQLIMSDEPLSIRRHR